MFCSSLVTASLSCHPWSWGFREERGSKSGADTRFPHFLFSGEIEACLSDGWLIRTWSAGNGVATNYFLGCGQVTCLCGFHILTGTVEQGGAVFHGCFENKELIPWNTGAENGTTRMARSAPLTHFLPCSLARDMLLRVLLREGAGEHRWCTIAVPIDITFSWGWRNKKDFAGGNSMGSQTSFTMGSYG